MFKSTWRPVLTGEKTETRRLIRPGMKVVLFPGTSSVATVYGNKRVIYQAGKSYAVQPGCGRFGLYYIRRGRTLAAPLYIWSEWGLSTPTIPGFTPARIEILAMYVESLKDMERVNALREGCPVTELKNPLRWYRDLWDELNPQKGARWEDDPDVLVIRFRLVEMGYGHLRSGDTVKQPVGAVLHADRG